MQNPNLQREVQLHETKEEKEAQREKCFTSALSPEAWSSQHQSTVTFKT